ncbi:hypothetical protein OH76DRAFT_1244564 [Lentinus brumalis]|uniref:N-acetyltransferase domain-containing protein n=1 Tax=Lentinus brumalis TaxID=2498619 RepID=A0A371CS09_9APHY|nr:hypothetical protein OH76DRAFT_1244564 [Polyporus brumalis]
MDKPTAAVHSGTTYAVCAIPDPPSSADIHDYREVRLTALRTDPSAYSSTYEREAAFDEETWRARLTGSGNVTLVARARRPDTLDGSTEGRGEGVGCMRVIAARSLPAGEGPQGVDPGRDYFVFGMWVRPEHRRRGVGSMLLENGLAWVLEDAAARMGSEGAAGVWLAVTATNSGAKRMYEEAGFRELSEEHSADDLPGEIWMSRKVQVNAFNEL